MIAHIAPSTIQHITPSLEAFSSLSPVSAIVANLDESIKGGLEAARDLYFWLLVISTVVVFVGVVLEEAEGWLSYLKSVLQLQPITEYRLTKKLAKLGWILICAGVMGEGVFEALVAKADNVVLVRGRGRCFRGIANYTVGIVSCRRATAALLLQAIDDVQI